MRVPGFKFAGVACGIKKTRRKDLALIFSERPAVAAALFTTNWVKAAPVIVGMRHIKRGLVQAVVINSGVANACTGAQGLRDAEVMCRDVASCLDIDAGLVLPSSTGLIGVPLPMDKIRSGIEKAADLLSEDSFSQAARAILTTDRDIKTSSAGCRVEGKKVVVAGMAKGAGMIAPKMATMLAYIMTDAAVEPRCLRAMLRRAVAETFNAITVDGDMSTNDTVLFMANGVAGNSPIKSGSREEDILFSAAREVMETLALKLVEDGEGATKVVEIRVLGSRSSAEAKKVAYTVATSQLVKTAFFGEDPNYGRIMAAIGRAEVPIKPDRVDIFFDGVTVVRRGAGVNAAETEAGRVLKQPSFTVRINLRQGNAAASVWTSDLTHDYVRLNSAYRT
ncbi:MAG: bifunctional glutamate N-acetyltransferase/amino-acid acetyltransferase ArgJ [Deltaproteobacteria bacterium]|nr:bifunctional glutamate N-acetyltransferase/amino-acid acetyltransferase ArgJ [Deltaproteobacteria bacterium]